MEPKHLTKTFKTKTFENLRDILWENCGSQCNFSQASASVGDNFPAFDENFVRSVISTNPLTARIDRPQMGRLLLVKRGSSSPALVSS